MAHITVPDGNVTLHHTNMIAELGGLFATNSKEWSAICSQCTMLGYITIADMSYVKSMFDLCNRLKANGIIQYGNYQKLKNILNGENVEAGYIIDKFTKLINKEQRGNGRQNTNKPQPMFSERDGSDGKRKQEPSGDPDPGDGFMRDKRVKTEEECLYQFRKRLDIDTHDARIIDVWTRARNAVGRIRGPYFAGTGIRVGSKYILTAYHVAADITKQSKSDDVDWSKLDSEQVWVEFNFPQKSQKFYFEPELLAGDRDIDFAILEVKIADVEIPKPITKFGKPANFQSFALLGHPAKPKSENMQIDFGIKHFDLDAEENSKRRGNMMENGKEKPGYEGIRDKGKVLFDCWVQHGASGSPGIVMGNDYEEPICTLMLVRGFPEQAFSENADISPEEMIEQGVTMEVIANKLWNLGKHAKTLKKEIFGEHFP